MTRGYTDISFQVADMLAPRLGSSFRAGVSPASWEAPASPRALGSGGSADQEDFLGYS